MPIETIILDGEPIVICVLTGETTGRELVAWRMDLGTHLDVSRHHIVYDALACASAVSDADATALMAMLRDPPTMRWTVIVSTDPMMPLWARSVALRAGSAVPGRRFTVVPNREAALALLRAAEG